MENVDMRGKHGNHARGQNHPRWRGGNPTPDPVKRRENAKASSKRYPLKRTSRQKIHDAVRQGKIPRVSTLSCMDCGGQAARYDHYAGYDKPLDVQPVCAACDGKRIKARGEIKYPNRVGPSKGHDLPDDLNIKQFPRAL